MNFIKYIQLTIRIYIWMRTCILRLLRWEKGRVAGTYQTKPCIEFEFNIYLNVFARDDEIMTHLSAANGVSVSISFRFSNRIIQIWYSHCGSAGSAHIDHSKFIDYFISQTTSRYHFKHLTSFTSAVHSWSWKGFLLHSRALFFLRLHSLIVHLNKNRKSIVEHRTCEVAEHHINAIKINAKRMKKVHIRWNLPL